MRTACAIFLVLLGAREIMAHPVAQGSIEIVFAENKIELHARVSPEEVFVANQFAPQGAESLPLAYAQHGQYLLQHLHLSADGRELAGHLARSVPPQAGTEAARAIYDFEFPIAAPPRSLALAQDVLNEFAYAPGNRWEATYLVQVREGGRAIVSGALLTSTSPLDFSLASHPSSWRLAIDYLRHGILHILTGYDHLLFIGALALAVANFWELFKVIAVFTFAHTITLTLSVLDLARLSSGFVEPMIAFSIVVVALQNVCWPRRSRGGARLAVAFFFGLFHGLGFAGGLLEAMSGLPGVSVALAIVAFSIGVEIGHQCVVLPLFGLTRLVHAWPGPTSGTEPRRRPHEILFRGGSAIICACGLFYLVAALHQLVR